MPTTARKITEAQQRRDAVESELGPLYALAGLTDLVAEKVTSTIRTRLNESQQQASERFAALRNQPGELERQAKLNVDELTAFLRTLPAQLRDLPTQTRSGFAVLQQQADSYRSTAEATYVQFAGRGKSVVDEAIVSARQAAGRAQTKGKETVEDLTETATDTADPVFEKVQESVTEARRRTTGKSATETMSPRSRVKAARTSAASAPKNTATTTTKKAAAKKAAGTKAAGTKNPGTKNPAKKTPATKVPAAKAPTAKNPTNKTPAKKTAKKA